MGFGYNSEHNCLLVVAGSNLEKETNDVVTVDLDDYKSREKELN